MRHLQSLLKLVLLFAGFSLLSPVSAQTKWDLYAFPGASHPITVRLGEFAAEVRKQTEGQLIITVRPSGEFPFKATEVVRATGTGQVQMGEGYSGFISGSTPLASIANLPLLVRNSDELDKVWPIIKKYAEPELEKAGVKTLFYFSWPPQNLFGRGPQIKTIEEFAGRKFRTTDGKQSEMLKRLGGSAVSLTLAEVPLAVERGVVDGFMTAGFNVVGAKWSEFVNWGYVPGIHAGGPDYIMVNIDAYKKLKPEVRAVLDKVAAVWGPKMTIENAADETRDLEILKNKFKVDLFVPPQDQIDKLTELMKPYWTSWAEAQGPNAVAAVKEIRAVLNR